MKTSFITSVVVGLLGAGTAMAADTVANSQAATGSVDFANAKPLPLPMSAAAPGTLQQALAAPPAFTGRPGVSPGAVGNGQTTPTRLPVNANLSGGPVAPQQFGTSNQPFTTARADLSGLTTTSAYPYRAAGKLFFNKGSSTYVCSASLIKRGLVVTAAHCVFDYGKKTSGWYSNYRFVPAYSNGAAPYGTWYTRSRRIMSAYYNGTDSCATAGVVCANDIAVVELTAQSGAYPGTRTGWYGYGWDGYGFTGSGVANNNLTHITQLGYPVALDNGQYMERTDSYGYTSSSSSYNTIIGSQQTGGSSGGPWLVNFGLRSTVTGSDAAAGSEANSNVVVGTTSWGYISAAPRQQGASPFRSSNIVSLVNAACAGAASTSVCN